MLRVVRGLLATACFTGIASPLQGGDAETGERTETFASRLLPGAIGAQGHPQAGPFPEVSPALQPVSIQGPKGMTVSVETFAGWSAPAPAPFRTALLVGSTYRVRLGGIPGYEGLEVYPTIRILARLATPPGMDRRFPVDLVLDENDLVMAVEGAHVERIVYMDCDPDTADISAANWFDVRPCDDPRDVAATLGAPVAEIVLGNRLPSPGVVP